MKRSTYERLRERWPTLRAGAVEMVHDSKSKRALRARKGEARVRLPYEGPELVELLVDDRVATLAELTTTEELQRCGVCGRTSRVVVGVEAKEHRWDGALVRLVTVRVPPEEGRGVFVRAADVKGLDLFRVGAPLDGILLCTDAGKRLIEAASLTNVDFLLYGEICP